MGLVWLLLGVSAGQFSGAWAYRQVHGGGPSAGKPDIRAAVVGATVATLIASVIFVLCGIHDWIGGPDTP